MKAADFISKLWSDVTLESVVLPGKQEIRSAIPDWLADSPVVSLIKKETSGQDPWSHQVLALDAWNRGENVIMASGTNSGKTLVSQIAFLDRMLAEPDSTYMIVPPYTALNQNQFSRWEEAFRHMNLPPEWFAKIDHTEDRHMRAETIKKARFLFITPHSQHGWLLDQLDNPDVTRFVKNTRGVFLDEVQTYEGVMGANSMFLFKRLNILSHILNGKNRLQWIAASGSISRPGAFAKKLVGVDFTAINAIHDGSRQSARTIFHLPASNRKSINARVVETAAHAVEHNLPGLIMIFIDSRDRVDQIAHTLQQRLGADNVIAYSARYSKEYQRDAIRKIEAGKVKIVVATSALQSGIHIENAALVIQDGVPLKTNDFKQRLGRSGRSEEEAAFVLVGDGAKFRYFEKDSEEKSLAAYVHMPAEDPPFPHDNQALAFIHAQCLRREIKRTGSNVKIPVPASWPELPDLIKLARTKKEHMPPELRPLKVAQNRSPNTEFPLLNNGTGRCFLYTERDGKRVPLGEMPVDIAMRECPPGGNSREYGGHWFVERWSYMGTKSGKPSWQIRLKPTTSRGLNRSIITHDLCVQLHRGNLMQDHFQCSTKGPEYGFIGEVTIDDNTKLVGYQGSFISPGGEMKQMRIKYRDNEIDDEAAEDQPKKSPYYALKLYKKTTGVVIHIPQPWFTDEARVFIAESLIKSHMRWQSQEIYEIRMQNEIGYSTENLTIEQALGDRSQGSSLAIYDMFQGSLRLTQPFYDNFRLYLEDLLNDGVNNQELTETQTGYLQKALDWYETLTPHSLPSPVSFAANTRYAPAPQGMALAFAVGSIVDRERDGVRESMRIAGHEKGPDVDQPFLYKLQWQRKSYKSADAHGAAQEEIPLIVAPDEIQMPLTHTRFSKVWIDLNSLATCKPDILPAAAAVSSTPPTPEI